MRQALCWLVEGMREDVKSSLDPSPWACKLGLLTHCCLSNAVLATQFPQNVLLKKCHFGICVQWVTCPCALPATLPACAHQAAVGPAVSSGRFLGPCCSSGVQITLSCMTNFQATGGSGKASRATGQLLGNPLQNL